MEISFQVFHELMSCKIREILLVASPYDAFIMEEDGSLASLIIAEYQGLNLSQPPRIQRVGSAAEALRLIGLDKYDLVITMPNVEDMDARDFGRQVKRIAPLLPVVLLAHTLRPVSSAPERIKVSGIDHFFIWLSDPSLLLAIVKNVEDHSNVFHDTEKAGVRVLILVEDSPYYLSYLLPKLYNEVVKQTQSVLADTLNDEHRLLKMRARPKILAVSCYEDAIELFKRYQPYVFGVISDGRFPRSGNLDDRAGLRLLADFRARVPDLPLLLMSADTGNREEVLALPAVFLDKNSLNLEKEIHDFFLHHLGFGDFVFRLPDGSVVGWADSLHSFEQMICSVPDESLLYHASRNHFSNWIMARSEIDVAGRLHALQLFDFSSLQSMRSFLAECIHRLRIRRQKGIVVQFAPDDFDADVMDFVKIGSGSLGGKARGVAFMANYLATGQQMAGDAIRIKLPRTLVIASDGYEEFVESNGLVHDTHNFSDEEIAGRFLDAELPGWLAEKLKNYLGVVKGPLSIRSSSLQEDTLFKPYAGLYSTYMLPNNQADFSVRFKQFCNAIKLIFASTCFAGPRAFGERLQAGGQKYDDRMAVIVQQVVGSKYGEYFYPAISGVAQSWNFYPIAPMLPEDGIAHIALGFGKTVVEGEKSLRFSPHFPEILPQFSTVDDVLRNAQHYFYALHMVDYPENLSFDRNGNLIKRLISEAGDEFPVRMLTSSYIREEHRIRDGSGCERITTFAQVLKYKLFPLPELIKEVLDIGRRGMGCPVEIEFAVNLNEVDPAQSEFYFLQMRPMISETGEKEVDIADEEIAESFCYSQNALGHGKYRQIRDILYIPPETFDGASAAAIAREIGMMNNRLLQKHCSYLLIGPGRWGSADHWLGIPVQWQDISGVGAIVELRTGKLQVEPSQGTHFFHNITSMGIPYITVDERKNDRIDLLWMQRQTVVEGLQYLQHVRCDSPLVIKINGRNSRCVMLK